MGQLAATLLRGAGMVLRGETMGQAMPAEGSRAPSFSVVAHDGTVTTLEQFHGKSHVVLFFFPKADTPG
jgi:peroxiredoxin